MSSTQMFFLFMTAFATLLIAYVLYMINRTVDKLHELTQNQNYVIRELADMLLSDTNRFDKLKAERTQRQMDESYQNSRGTIMRDQQFTPVV